MRIVFSIEPKPYLLWQKDLLLYSLKKCGWKEKITILVNGKADIPLGVIVANYRWMNGENYSVRNKCFGLKEWLSVKEARDEILLVIDPDFVFWEIPKIDIFPKGEIIVGSTPYLKERPRIREPKIGFFGPPMFVWESDLRKIVEPWCNYTNKIWPQLRTQVVDMWALIYAIEDLGISCQIREDLFCSPKNEEKIGPESMLHYCWGFQRWHKHNQSPEVEISELYNFLLSKRK